VQPVQQVLHLGADCLGAPGCDQPPVDPVEKLESKLFLQPGESPADRGLGDAEQARRFGGGAGFEYCGQSLEFT